jgi:hypothetical protein
MNDMPSLASCRRKTRRTETQTSEQKTYEEVLHDEIFDWFKILFQSYPQIRTQFSRTAVESLQQTAGAYHHFYYRTSNSIPTRKAGFYPILTAPQYSET